MVRPARVDAWTLEALDELDELGTTLETDLEIGMRRRAGPKSQEPSTTYFLIRRVWPETNPNPFQTLPTPEIAHAAD